MSWNEGYSAETYPPKGVRVLAKWKERKSELFGNFGYDNHYGNLGSEWGVAVLISINSSQAIWSDDEYFCSAPERWWPLPGTDMKLFEVDYK